MKKLALLITLCLCLACGAVAESEVPLLPDMAAFADGRLTEVESGYYVLEKEKDYLLIKSENIAFYLSYAYPGRITPCRNTRLDGYDLVVYVNVEDEFILWTINPAITICD